jgi:syntaxin 6
LKEQDSNLEQLGASVARLGEISLNISEEINSQNKMLSRLETDTETAEDKVSSLTEKTKDLIKKAGGKKNFCLILTLIFILMILTFLVIYT